MKKLIYPTIFLLLLTGCNNNYNEELMDDFVFNDAEALTQKYGTPVKIDHSDESSMAWQLENGAKVKVFYLNSLYKNPEVVRFTNLDIDPDLFYNDFGWRKPEVNKNKFNGVMTYTGLFGIQEATYNPNLKTLNVILDSPSRSDFGKLMK